MAYGQSASSCDPLTEFSQISNVQEMFSICKTININTTGIEDFILKDKFEATILDSCLINMWVDIEHILYSKPINQVDIQTDDENGL